MVLLPAPGGPVMPTQYPLPRAGARRRMISGTSALCRSTWDISCANARWLPASILSTKSTAASSSHVGAWTCHLLRPGYPSRTSGMHAQDSGRKQHHSSVGSKTRQEEQHTPELASLSGDLRIVEEHARGYT